MWYGGFNERELLLWVLMVSKRWCSGSQDGSRVAGCWQGSTLQWWPGQHPARICGKGNHGYPPSAKQLSLEGWSPGQGTALPPRVLTRPRTYHRHLNPAEARPLLPGVQAPQSSALCRESSPQGASLCGDFSSKWLKMLNQTMLTNPGIFQR